MDKGKIRVALAALSVAGLVAGVTMTGCRSSCTGGSHNGSMPQQQHKAVGSCSPGSCSVGSCVGAPKSKKPAMQ